jgi:hypothetical protein
MSHTQRRAAIAVIIPLRSNQVLKCVQWEQRIRIIAELDSQPSSMHVV